MFENAPLRIRPPHLRWRVVPVPAGDYLMGWLAGPQVTVDVHWNSGCSKPCRDLLTKSALLCECLKEPKSIRTIGYVPIITPEREQLVLIVSATVAAAVADFVFGTPLEFHRSKKSRTPLRVKLSANGKFSQQNNLLFKQGQPRDIKPYLLHLWQDEQLANHFGYCCDGAPICVRSTNPTNETPSTLASVPSARDNEPTEEKTLPKLARGSRKSA